MTYTKDTIEFAPLPTRPSFHDLTDLVLENLTVLGFAGHIKGRSMWFCECVCGAITRITGYHLTTGHTKSCGCKKFRVTHGESRNQRQSTEYQAYHQAKYRCNNPDAQAYAYYGERGIEFRFTSFEEFLNHIGRKPAPEYTLERKKVNGHYEKGNVEWALPVIQARNKRNNRILTVKGQSLCVTEWAERANRPPTSLFKRILLGYCDECVVLLPLKEKCPHHFNSPHR